MRLRPAPVLALTAVSALALSACGSNGSGASTTTSTTTTVSGPTSGASSTAQTAAATPTITPAPTGDLAGITVSGTPDKPVVKIDKPPYDAKETTVKVLSEGTGPVVKLSDMTVANALFASGKTGKTLEDTFARKSPQQIPVKGWLPGVAKAMLGHKAGSRLLVSIAPQDAFGATGQPQAGVQPNETLVSVVQIVKVGFAGADCKVVTSQDGLPAVKATDGKAPTITPVKAAPPAVPTLYVLKEGTGKPVEAGQTLSAQYTGLLWTTGAKFDSSYDAGGKPVDFPIGVRRVIPAWDKCLTGQKVGSRVLLVAPPKEAYGAQSQPKIPANSTLVFVVDMVAAK